MPVGYLPEGMAEGILGWPGYEPEEEASPELGMPVGLFAPLVTVMVSWAVTVTVTGAEQSSPATPAEPLG